MGSGKDHQPEASGVVYLVDGHQEHDIDVEVVVIVFVDLVLFVQGFIEGIDLVFRCGPCRWQLSRPRGSGSLLNDFRSSLKLSLRKSSRACSSSAFVTATLPAISRVTMALPFATTSSSKH